ncbi:MAG TPA: hypothetical protein VFZ65_22310 [Planctomycetota bacterium]|nr:hypothetical protein [Planctomycetota bacterium]
MPLRWQTESVRVGETDLLGERPTVEHTDWRFEYRHDRVVEAYDVRGGGLAERRTSRR